MSRRTIEEMEQAAFYQEHYSDWTVHALRLTVYVPLTEDSTEADSLALVREILDDAAFDIRVSVIQED
jgi:hypothetical protein